MSRRSYAASIKKALLTVELAARARNSRFLSLSLSPSCSFHGWRLRGSSLSLGGDVISLAPLFWWLRCRSNAAGVAAACEWWQSGGAEGTEQTFYTALAELEAVRVHLLHVRTKMAAASLSERRGGSFFSVCLSRSPLGALIVAMCASARDSNLAARHTRLFLS